MSDEPAGGADDEIPLILQSRIDALRELNEPGEPDIVKEVVDLFLDDLPGRIRAMREHASDGEELKRAAHALKGSARNLGAELLAACAERIEVCAREARLHQAAPHLAELPELADRTEAALRELAGG